MMHYEGKHGDCPLDVPHDHVDGKPARPLSKQNQWLLNLLKDDMWHDAEEIRVLSHLKFGKQISLHPRITDLRERGYRIDKQRRGRGYTFRLSGRGAPPVPPPNQAPVQGYIFNSAGGGDDPRNGNVCKIIGRANASEQDLLTYGPMFYVKFGDDEEDTAFSAELSPWFPT